MALILHVDGGSRGNPGPAAAGVVLQEDGKEPLLEAGYVLGKMTNNQAEYTALLIGLRSANRCDTDELTIYSDSELMVRQLTGEYRVKSEQLKPLYAQARRELLGFASWNVRHVMRERNERADRLLNQALDLNEDFIAVDALPPEG